MAQVDDDPEELPPQGLDAPVHRRLALGVFAGWMILQIATPLSYYVSDDVYDERFAWRMFSAVRVQDCDVDARETVNGSERTIDLQTILPAPWIALIGRNRPAVLRRYLTYRCGAEAHPSEVSLTHRCRSAAGEPLPAIHRTMTCEGLVLEESTDE
ncbi:MAG: hypothetical protein U0234_26000 [Sandaracinus sp.]